MTTYVTMSDQIWLTVLELAERYGLHPNTVRAYRRAGLLAKDFRRPGAKQPYWKIEVGEFERWLAEEDRKRREAAEKVDQVTLQVRRGN